MSILSEGELEKIGDDVFLAQKELKAAYNKFRAAVRNAREKGVADDTENKELGYIFWVRKLSYTPTVEVTDDSIGDKND